MNGSASRRWSALAFAVLFGLQIASLIRMRCPYVVDDAPFFFRYAENLAAGHGYRWNVEEPPVWGASAPLWPLLLALGVKLGLGVAQASLAWSWILTLAATGLLGRVVHRLFGSLGVLALAPLLSANYLYSFYATAGLETPLGFFLLAAALATVAFGAPAPVLGAVAGLCLVHKLDFAPVGLAVLAGAWRWRRPLVVRSWITAGAVALLWYGFAAWHFGSLVPNSMLRKLDTPSLMGRAWFASTLFWERGGLLQLVLSLAGLVALRSRRYLVCVALGAIVPQLVAYTLKPPGEPFEWYVAASSPAVAFLAACGLARSLQGLLRVQILDPRLRTTLAPALLLLLTWTLVALERPRVHRQHSYLRNAESVRIAAGQWIAENTPPDARLHVREGHMAYHSRRFVYDASFLNRKPETGTRDLIAKYKPDVLAITLLKGHVLPRYPREYHIAHTITAPGGGFPHVVVLTRERARPRPEFLRRLLAGVSPEHRPAARRLVLATFGGEPAGADVPPALLAELGASLALLEPEVGEDGADTERARRGIARLEARIARK